MLLRLFLLTKRLKKQLVKLVTLTLFVANDAEIILSKKRLISKQFANDVNQLLLITSN